MKEQNLLQDQEPNLKGKRVVFISGSDSRVKDGYLKALRDAGAEIVLTQELAGQPLDHVYNPNVTDKILESIKPLNPDAVVMVDTGAVCPIKMPYMVWQSAAPLLPFAATLKEQGTTLICVDQTPFRDLLRSEREVIKNLMLLYAGIADKTPQEVTAMLQSRLERGRAA